MLANTYKYYWRLTWSYQISMRWICALANGLGGWHCQSGENGIIRYGGDLIWTLSQIMMLPLTSFKHSSNNFLSFLWHHFNNLSTDSQISNHWNWLKSEDNMWRLSWLRGRGLIFGSNSNIMNYRLVALKS